MYINNGEIMYEAYAVVGFTFLTLFMFVCVFTWTEHIYWALPQLYFL